MRGIWRISPIGIHELRRPQATGVASPRSAKKACTCGQEAKLSLSTHTRLQTSGFPHREESPFSRACDRDTVTGPKTECLYSHPPQSSA